MEKEKYFKVGNLEVISRGDYESLPIPMCTEPINDNTMQEIANNIVKEMVTCYGENDVKDYFSKKLPYDERFDEIDDCFWREMETCALNKGMGYYD